MMMVEVVVMIKMLMMMMRLKKKDGDVSNEKRNIIPRYTTLAAKKTSLNS